MSIKNRKLQVFVSSTFTDLREERQAAVEAILSTGNIPAGMELFAAGDQSQMEVIKEWIRDSDVYLLILGGRYGSIESESKKSYTQLEYEYAVKIGKPHFAVVVSEEGLALKVERQGEKEVVELVYPDKHEEFKRFVTGSKMVRFWDDLKDIKLSIHETLSNFSKREELVGWIRGDQVANNALLAEELARLGKANAELREYLSELEQELEKKGSPFFEDLYEIFEETQIDISNFPPHLIYSWPSDDLVDANEFILTTQKIINGFVEFSVYDFQRFFTLFSNYKLIDYEVKRDAKYSSIPSAAINCVTSKFTQTGVEYLVFLEKRLRSV